MSIPKFYEFFEQFLMELQDEQFHTAKEVRQGVAKRMNLSAEDLSEMLPSGRQTTYANRMGWARTYLNKAGLVENPVRGRYRITETGKRALESGDKIDLKYLEQFEAYQNFKEISSVKEASSDAGTNNDASPTENLDAAFKQVNDTLASDLMDEVMKLTPTEFENLVVRLLLQMGYGSGIEEAGMVTQPSNDGGIDGIIKEDQLGFSSIYIQAKQWAVDSTVGKPEIQKFVGALQGQQAQKGLFITTARFSRGAWEYANNLLGAKIVLVDGPALMRLMIKHNVGVSVEHTYEVKRIDSDFFNDEL
ncbi:MAG: restriction endonuclease [Eubacteriales bacterium]|nr:restriction endonuclease [Eubacteriales bacterium]